MVDIEKLRGYIVESGIKQKIIAQKAGIHESAFSLILNIRYETNVFLLNIV